MIFFFKHYHHSFCHHYVDNDYYNNFVFIIENLLVYFIQNIRLSIRPSVLLYLFVINVCVSNIKRTKNLKQPITFDFFEIFFKTPRQKETTYSFERCILNIIFCLFLFIYILINLYLFFFL